MSKREYYLDLALAGALVSGDWSQLTVIDINLLNEWEVGKIPRDCINCSWNYVDDQQQFETSGLACVRLDCHD